MRASSLLTLFTTMLALACVCHPQTADSGAGKWAAAVDAARQSSPQARVIVLDIASGRLLAASNLAEAAHTVAAPGSTLKPLALYSLIASGRWDPSRRIACTRKLTVAGRSLNCSHPPMDPMDARQALTWSCNTYFAKLADAIGAQRDSKTLRSLLASSSLLSQTGLTPNEATADFRDPQTPDEIRLTLLGVDGIRVTPLELASAYRWLAMQMAAHPASTATQTVLAGLTDSASFGVAGAASLGGVPVMGKTGTANQGQGTPSHGWFVGFAPAEKPTAVIAIFLPTGHGANAAHVAADILAHSLLKDSEHAR